MERQRKSVVIWLALACLAIIAVINLIFNHASISSASEAHKIEPTSTNAQTVASLQVNTTNKQQTLPDKENAPTGASVAVTPPAQGNVVPPLGTLIENIPTKDHKTIYLTFDDGPGTYTRSIASILQQYGIHGSFFWIGDQVTNQFGQIGHQLIQQGNVIGSHTMHHDALGKESASKQSQDLTATAALLEKKIGHKIVYMRPPYGSVNKETGKVSKAIGEYIIFWQIDSLDWSLARNPDKILVNIQRGGVKPGSIILMHERKQTVKMLPKVIQYLRSKGYNMAALPASPIPQEQKTK
ncbi:polysaccharide deacetylase family protein [Aneurinibacillus sp. Ricciae_BoGa-3]|uniref:polysaccharide deacetylase family protein n=1 Tax=Aneurinibacillus sp. Ricciae_BoGa-3 TaxID=3022697 RepID=UPI002341534A|nr:polysaccharide deacetylase family protein [Aneurinibacillus sp. Ricciae_BoGa-3]WCK54238.1 polysaccharide deacetylase family protein [Aneurinibacillus sp. Ricciae_BoGa-3]